MDAELIISFIRAVTVIIWLCLLPRTVSCVTLAAFCTDHPPGSERFGRGWVEESRHHWEPPDPQSRPRSFRKQQATRSGTHPLVFQQVNQPARASPMDPSTGPMKGVPKEERGAPYEGRVCCLKGVWMIIVLNHLCLQGEGLMFL